MEVALGLVDTNGRMTNTLHVHTGEKSFDGKEAWNAIMQCIVEDLMITIVMIAKKGCVAALHHQKVRKKNFLLDVSFANLTV